MRTRVGIVLATAVLLQTAAAGARERPCPPVIFGKAHESLERAAAATFQKLFFANQRYEHGGFFIHDNGRFRASEPVTQRSRSDVRYCIVLPRGAKLAGIYHTHVASPELSPRDRKNAERMGVPSYVGTVRDGSLLVYDAHAGKTHTVWSANGDDRAAALATTGTRPTEPAATMRSRAAELLDKAAAALQRWNRAAQRALFANER